MTLSPDAPREHVTIMRRLKAAAMDAARRYHSAVPTCLDIIAGTAKRPGPIFRKEAQFLQSLALLIRPETIVEVGVGGAASTIAFAEALRQNNRGHLLSIDLNSVLVSRAERLLRALGLRDRVTFHHGRSESTEAIDFVRRSTSRIDLLMIDGNHSYRSCRADFEAYRDLLAPSAIVVFHDTGPMPASEAAMVSAIVPDVGEMAPVWTADRKGIMHRPDVARVVDHIVAENPEFSLIGLHTLTEPCCGMAILQRTQKLFGVVNQDPVFLNEGAKLSG